MVLVTRGDLVELVLQRAHPGDTVYELEVTPLFVIPAGIVDDGTPHRLVHPAGDLEGDLRVVEALCPGILVVYPEHLARLAEHAADAIEEHRLAVGEVKEEISDRPLSRPINPHEILLTQREVLQRFVSGGFQLSNQLHAHRYA